MVVMVGGEAGGWKMLVTFLGLASYATLYYAEAMIFTVLFNSGKLRSDLI